MKWNREGVVAIILLVALVLGCAAAGGYGTMRVEEGGGMTVETLVNTWQNYEIYYAGDGNLAVAVLFDPKTDGKTLRMGPRWDRMPDLNTLNKMVNYIRQQPIRGVNMPRLWAVRGPDDSTYGYVYTLLTKLVINVIDDKTMLVESVT
jgi:hypothetical protein